jgi:hypothetical protein
MVFPLTGSKVIGVIEIQYYTAGCVFNRVYKVYSKYRVYKIYI